VFVGTLPFRPHAGQFFPLELNDVTRVRETTLDFAQSALQLRPSNERRAQFLSLAVQLQPQIGQVPIGLPSRGPHRIDGEVVIRHVRVLHRFEVRAAARQQYQTHD
jgi:hypothetical protein